MDIGIPPSFVECSEFFEFYEDKALHRIHRSDFDAAQFNPGCGGPTRFAPFKCNSKKVVPSQYACDTVRAAIHETIFHDISANANTKTVRWEDVQIRTHSEFRIVRGLKLAELRNVTLSKWGISREDLISTGPTQYYRTVLWAKSIHRDNPNVHGLAWTSNQCDPDNAFLFFGDRVDKNDFQLVKSRDGRIDESFQTDVGTEGCRRGITLTI